MSKFGNRRYLSSIYPTVRLWLAQERTGRLFFGGNRDNGVSYFHPNPAFMLC